MVYSLFTWRVNGDTPEPKDSIVTSPSSKTGHGENWTSQVGFMLACIGSAIGLGNLWKFPYITYENGGGAFVLVYLACILVIGIPILIAETLIGRHGKLGIYGSFSKLTRGHRGWRTAACLCILSSFFVLSFYSVVAGWTVEYFIHSLTGALSSLTLDSVGPRFGAFVSSPWKQIFYHTLFMGITVALLLRGTRGIEQAVKILMPLLAVMVLVVMSLSVGRYGASTSLNFLFSADFSRLTAPGILEALGHAFFTLSLGFGAMVVYGSYLPRGTSLTKSALLIAFFDTLIALMACLMMYPIIFGSHMELHESASMLFTSLTVQFHSLTGGQFVSALFYLLVAVAALSSTISLLEIVVSFVAEEFSINRTKATLIGGGSVWFVGIFSATSNGAWAWTTNLGIMDTLDYLTSNWGLPLGGALISLFAGWCLSKDTHSRELGLSPNSLLLNGWRLCVQYICPFLVFVVLLFKVGAL